MSRANSPAAARSRQDGFGEVEAEKMRTTALERHDRTGDRRGVTGRAHAGLHHDISWQRRWPSGNNDCAAGRFVGPGWSRTAGDAVANKRGGRK